MIKENLDKIEEIFTNAENLDQTKKEELLGLTQTLREELFMINESQSEEASSIADFTHISAKENLKPQRDQELAEISLKGLETSIRNFNSTHPELTRTIGRIINIISNIGV